MSGDVINRGLSRLDLNRRDKADHSPVTAADEASDALIRTGLNAFMPGVPVVTEESTGHRAVAGLGERFFIVDPLDGTREFLAGLDEYSVNIALVENGTPVAGVIAAPSQGVIWRGRSGHGAERLVLPPGEEPAKARERVALHTRACPPSGPRVLISRSYRDPATDAYIERLPQAEKVIYGSSLKFCMLAEGRADVYPRLGPISEWDIAAGHAVLVAAGGELLRPDGGDLRYGEGDFRVKGFIARGERTAR